MEGEKILLSHRKLQVWHFMKMAKNDEKFRIQIAGERIRVPPHAIINIEHEIGKQTEEIEFQLKWKIAK